jgi:hypothetical protein
MKIFKENESQGGCTKVYQLKSGSRHQGDNVHHTTSTTYLSGQERTSNT